MRSRPLSPAAFAALLLAGFVGCNLPAERTGTCQPPVALEIGTFERAESFHDDCRGPDGAGDIFVLTVDSQVNIVVEVTPEGGFSPTLDIYSGTFGDVDPPMMAELTAGFGASLRVRAILAPGPYFLVVGSASNIRATYRVSATHSVGADCSLWNFASPGTELTGHVTTADCPLIGDILRAESFEIWRQKTDSMTLTLIADSSGVFSFGESCCENMVVFQEQVSAGDSITIGHRAPRTRPYRASFTRDVAAEGPATYRLKIQ